MASNEQFYYYASVRNNTCNKSFSEEPMETMIEEAFPKLDDWQVYLCGNPKLVNKLRKQTFLAGVSMQQIFSDSFVNKYNI